MSPSLALLDMVSTPQGRTLAHASVGLPYPAARLTQHKSQKVNRRSLGETPFLQAMNAPGVEPVKHEQEDETISHR